MAENIPLVTFENGCQYPALGLGTWKSEPGQVLQAVKDAIDAGYRHIDCAALYLNQAEVGKAIQEKIDEGMVRREDLYITSKLWGACHKPDSVLPAFEKTLEELRLDYLDLYLMHSPMALQEGDDLFPKYENGKLIHDDVPYTETWKAMEKLAENGLVKSLGVSNFNSQQLADILEIAEIKPVTNQVECHPYLNQNKLKEFCNERGILLTAYSPLGTPDRPWASSDEPVLLKDPEVEKIAEKHEKSPAQILIKFQLQRGNLVVPKSVTKSRIIQNADVFDFTLENSDMDILNSLNRDLRYCGFPWMSEHKYYPFHIEF